MTPERFYELKNQREELRNFDLELSNKVAAQDKIKIEVAETRSTIKEFNGTDLPLYFKWVAISKWLFKVYHFEGKTKVDKMIISIDNEVEFSSSTINSAFDLKNELATKQEWEEGLKLLIKNTKR